jgi:large subunit ribosomal protein L20
MRVKRSVTARAKHKKVLRAAKGMGHGRQRSFRSAKQAVIRSQTYAYRDRRNRKRDFRRLWITRLNASLRELGTTYSQFMAQLKARNIELDRKVLSELAVNEPQALAEIVELTQEKSK